MVYGLWRERCQCQCEMRSNSHLNRHTRTHTHTSDSPVYRPKTPTRRWPPLSSDPFWILILFLDETYSRTNTQNKIDFTEWTKEWANKNNEKKANKINGSNMKHTHRHRHIHTHTRWLVTATAQSRKRVYSRIKKPILHITRINIVTNKVKCVFTFAPYILCAVVCLFSLSLSFSLFYYYFSCQSFIHINRATNEKEHLKDLVTQMET